MIVLVTDFGSADPYVGQMHAAIRARVDAPVIDLFHHMPNFQIRAGAYLLDALQRPFPPHTIFVAVVDPGVGSARVPVMVRVDDKWYVGPDNGLMNIVCRRARAVESLGIDWRPARMSASFHGRDLFAPVAARLACADPPACSPHTLVDTTGWPDELAEVVYVDHYGNAMTGIRADSVDGTARLRAGGQTLRAAHTFSAVGHGEVFWYRNALDLVEIAAREASAAAALGLKVGDAVQVIDAAAP